MVALYANENFPLPVVEALRALGYDVLTSQDVGNAGQAIPDEAVLRFAADQGRALLTINRKHFLKLHRASSSHAGLLLCTLDLDFAGQAARIHTALAGLDDIAGQLLRINRPA
ncbi:MAG TPA: DUF5615 family PIN-like protein [Chloroflexaceae bacterium]|nr:DUF5615 family PIN-like protein [Chloroflexaceae bacterium]